MLHGPVPQAGQELDLFERMVGFAPFVVIVSPDPYLLGASKVVVSGKDSVRRAGFVHQGYRKEGLGAGASRKIDFVKIREGVEDRI
jgi:hypothetical protein